MKIMATIPSTQQDPCIYLDEEMAWKLKEHGVMESEIILSNLFCTPEAAESVTTTFPDMKILTSEIDPVAPHHFGRIYFGTD